MRSDSYGAGVGGGFLEAAAFPVVESHLALEGDGAERVDLARPRVLPDLEHGRADVTVRVEVDRAERALVVDLFAGANQLDRLGHLKVGDLRPRSPRDAD